MDTQKGFHKGIAAMRNLLAQEFEKLGSGNFSGLEVAALIRQAPGPQKEEPQEEITQSQTVRLPA
jgi:hypothetical protein